MENFKSHKNTLIEFDTGISLIIGGNGAGKSSILEAVSFALFKQHTSKRIDQLITIGKKRIGIAIIIAISKKEINLNVVITSNKTL